MNKSAQRLHLQLRDTLQQRITDGYYKPESRFPTELELAQEFSLSRGTIRKALQLLEDRGILARQPGKGTFINQADTPHNELEAPSGLIGITVPHTHDRLSSNIIKGAERVTRERGYHLLYTNIENDLRIETEQLSRLKNQRVAGIILFPLATKGEPEILQDLICTIPTVLVDRELDEFCGSVVLSDNFNAAYQGVQYLLNQGHSRIACVSHLSDASSVIERIRGYQQAMRDAGRLPYATIKLLDCGAYPPGEIPEYAAEELIEIDHALSVPERPTAVFCINDYIAIGVMRLALSKGLCVPKDLSVLGFDNSVFAQLAPVPLSSIEQQEVEIGARACEMLLDKIANPDAAPQKILLPTRLILRASTAKE